jgi:hypothetical protein
MDRGGFYTICHSCQLKLREQFIKLPEALKDALCSDELTDAVYDICRKTGLSDDIIDGIIISYTGMVFSGIKSTQQFQKIIEKETNLKSDETEALVQRILSLFLVTEELQDWWMEKGL